MTCWILYFHDVVAADGFDDFVFGFIAIVFIVVLVAERCRGLFGVLRGGSFATSVVAVRRFVGMGSVFVSMFFVSRFFVSRFVAGQFFVGRPLMSFRSGRLGYMRRLDRRRSLHLRMPFRR